MTLHSTDKTHRAGALGALMDEYERAVAELKGLIERIPADNFSRVIDARTEDDDCRSAQTIMSHVARAAYGYADYMRARFDMPSTRPQFQLLTQTAALKQLDAALVYTAQTLDGKWEMRDEEINSVTINSRWGVVYNLEQLLEHAIVHVLRHRRQIEKFMQQGLIDLRAGA